MLDARLERVTLREELAQVVLDERLERETLREQRAQAVLDARQERNTIRGEQRIVARQQRMYKVVQQFWDYDDPCQYCRCIHLKGIKADNRSMCCRYGEAVMSNKCPILSHFLQYYLN